MSHHAARVLTFVVLALVVGCALDSAQRPERLDAQGPVSLERAFPRLRFQRPVFLTGAGDGSGRLFVVEQGGVIRSFEPSDDVATSDVFLDISERISREGNEEGLLGLAFAPDFAASGAFYVHYSSSVDDKVGIVARFLLDADHPGRADPDSQAVVLRQPQPYRNHNGGTIAFGPDDMLYISFGDGGAADDPHGNGQDLGTWLGAILRIDVSGHDGTYRVPADNPFVGGPDGALPEIWAYGLRNVWRFAFDRETGALWAADVGQNSWEEVDLIVRGGNYGWNTLEASHAFAQGGELTGAAATAPVAEYGRDLGVSITGGSVYRGRRHPRLRGQYFYGDYVSGNLWSLPADGSGPRDATLVCRTGKSIASFGEDDDGELYLTSFDGGVYRLVPSPSAVDPLAHWPAQLVDTGLFADLAAGQMAEHVIPYDVNVPFWSDGAGKQRFFTLPPGASFTYREQGPWDVPVGARLVKTFAATHRGKPRTLETRIIERKATGWEAATYVWAGNGQSATLMPAGQQFELWNRGQPIVTWHAPSSSECSSCHVESTGFALGLTTAQLDRTDADGRSQLATLVDAGLLTVPDGASLGSGTPHPALDDGSVPLEPRARAWLDVNCAMCHQPGGTGNATVDLRATTPLAATRMVDALPGQGDLGLPDARIVAPGDPARSVLWQRVHTLGDGRMPNVATHVRDEAGVALLAAWIESLAP